jgi:hypothetical protein
VKFVSIFFISSKFFPLPVVIIVIIAIEKPSKTPKILTALSLNSLYAERSYLQFRKNNKKHIENGKIHSKITTLLFRVL